MKGSTPSLLERFQAGQIEPAAFHHREHIEAAFEMLRKYPFLEAATRYAGTIQALAERVGASDKFNLTITLAFLSLIAERMAEVEYIDYRHFILENEDLASTAVLSRFYSPERLASSLARQVFLLPNRLGMVNEVLDGAEKTLAR